MNSTKALGKPHRTSKAPVGLLPFSQGLGSHICSSRCAMLYTTSRLEPAYDTLRKLQSWLAAFVNLAFLDGGVTKLAFA
ncbi:hypothetical protein VTL71DRAFT_253 [Oculimacula yallundae]|uniref:Uncharacterized protein n=1 Tax=Oculimacula yallundae TaxID=86028 RepID=A0ABR4CZG0_9HELO